MSPIRESPGVERSRSWIDRLLWIDGLAGLSAGVLMLGLRQWLAALYGLPLDTLTAIGVANLTYGTCGVTLASWPRRRIGFVLALAAANASWAAVCVVLALRLADRASPLGLGMLLFEAAFVATLAILEWRNREALATGAG